MKLPISIPRGAFKMLIVVLAALCGGTVGGILALAFKGLPVPDELGKFLVAVSGALVALVMGPKSKDDANETE